MDRKGAKRMSAFIDVQPFHWYHKNIDEMYHSYLADGTPFLAGIPYNIFKQGKEAIDYEVQATQSFSETTLNFLVQPTEDNPLVVLLMEWKLLLMTLSLTPLITRLL